MDKDLAKRYKEQRDALRRRYEVQKTGDQTLFTEHSKLFKPLIEVQKETSKTIGDKITTSKEGLSNVLVPFTRELRKRNEQIETLQNLPYYGIEDKPGDIIQVNLDAELLGETHRKNLQDMMLDLPSEVQEKGTIEEVLELIQKNFRSLGQFLGKASTKTPQEKEIFKSRKETLKIYRELIIALKGAKRFTEKSGEGIRRRKLCKLKRGRGRPRKYPDTIVYNNPNELCEKLADLVTAKEAGNTGLDNSINSILDELLVIKSINKDEYDKLFKTIFR